MLRVYVLSALLVVVLSGVESAMYSDVEKLFQDKIDNNNLNIKPLLNQSQTMAVNISFNLVSITEFAEVDQRFSCNAYLDVYWMDEILQWNPAEYGGLGMVWPPNDKVWRPNLALANIHNDFKTLAITSGIVMVMSEGRVKWAPGEAFQTFCHVDVSNYPFDKQRCDIELFIWGMSKEEVILNPIMDMVNMDSYKKNGEWDIKETKMVREVRGSTTLMSMIVVSFLLERRPLFYILNIVMPVIVLSILNVFVFLISVDSGEKLSFGVTVLLSFEVFISFISDMLPQTSESVCLLAVYMSCLLLLSAFYVCLSIIITRLYYKDDLDEPVPRSMRRLVKVLDVLSCIRSGRVHQGQEHKEKDGINVRKVAWPEEDVVNWKGVSRSLDRFFFRFFFLLIVIVTGVLLTKMTHGSGNIAL